MATSTALEADVDRLDSETLCASGTVLVWDSAEAQYLVIPATCKSWSCPTCAPRKRALWAAKLRAGKPWLAMTLTSRYRVWKETVREAKRMKIAFRSLVRLIRKKYGWFEYAAVWELQQNGMPHIHLLARAPYIHKAWLKRTWHQLHGAYMVDIHRIRHRRDEADHAVKSTAIPSTLRGYTPEALVSKQTSQSAQALRPMRIVQLSKHYLHPPGAGPQPDKSLRYSSAFTLAPTYRVVQAVESAMLAIPHVDLRSHVVTLRPYPGVPPIEPAVILAGPLCRSP